MALNGDPSRFSIYQKRPLSVDRLSEAHQDAFVMSEVIGVSRQPFAFQICRGGAHHAPVVAETLDAQRAVREFAIPDGQILALPYHIYLTIRHLDIDRHLTALGQQRTQ